MKTLLLKKVGTPYELEIGEVETPKPGKNEVRIRVHGTSINPVDYKFAKWGDSLPLPHILGIDAAGVIDETGEGVTGWKKGDRVIAMTNLYRWGAFAEYVVVDADVVSAIPDALTFESAAVIPCAGITAWQAFYRKLHLEKGQSVLITAAGGGVGGFAVQLAKMIGSKVYATASQNPERIKALGADTVIDYTKEDVVKRVMDLSGGRGIDAVIDLVSEESSASLLPVLRHNGQIVSIAGRINVNNSPQWAKSISIHEVALAFAYQHGDAENLKDIARGGEYMAKLIADGKIDPMINETIGFEQIPAALLASEAGHSKGKVVVRI